MSISKKVQHMLNEESFSGSEPKSVAHYGDMGDSAIEKITKFGRAAKEHAKSAIKSVKDNEGNIYQGAGKAAQKFHDVSKFSTSLAHDAKDAIVNKSLKHIASNPIQSLKNFKQTAPFVGDAIKNKMLDHPSATTAIAAGALGAGYGAYKYMKNRKNKK